MTTLCTNFKRNRPTFISKSAPVSQAEALKTFRPNRKPGNEKYKQTYPECIVTAKKLFFFNKILRDRNCKYSDKH